jgi:hypothetical protein
VALFFSKMPFSNLKEIFKKMKIWRFSLLIFAIFLFLNVFIESGLPEDVGGLKLPFTVFILLGFFLSFATGRVQVPLSILIPIYLIQNMVSIMPLFDFVFLYCAIFLGYLITPVHPCLSYSIEYLKASYKNSIKYLALPTFICLGTLFAFYAFFIIV